MGWWIIPTVIGAATSWFGGQQKAKAASDQNKAAEKQAEERFERAEKEWAIDYQSRVANWMWDVAETETARFIDRQKKADYEWRQGKLIDSALRNLEVNEEALYDKYVTQENLRAKQEGLALDYKMSTLAGDTGEALRQYMMDIRAKSLESQALVQNKNTEGQALQIDLTNGYAEEAMKRDADTVAGVVASSVDKARTVTRTGGSSTGHRQSLNALQALGRSYGEMAQRNRSRQTRIGIYNGSMQGEVATRMGSYALSMMDNAQRMKYSSGKYSRDGNNALNTFKELTIPSFELAAKQGGRELESLHIGTEARINDASMPFRESIIFDPIEPIAGLKPDYYAPTKVYEPTGVDIALGAIQSGYQGAMSMSYQNEGGGLGFF
jgi:hypothetical protein